MADTENPQQGTFSRESIHIPPIQNKIPEIGQAVKRRRKGSEIPTERLGKYTIFTYQNIRLYNNKKMHCILKREALA